MASIAFRVAAKIAGIASGAGAAAKYLTSDVKKIEFALTKKSGSKTTYAVVFEDENMVDDSFIIDVAEFDGNVTAQQATVYLADILNTELKKHYGDSASITLKLTKVHNHYGNGKAKGRSELKDGTTYSVTVQNDQYAAKHPVLYCNGVQVDYSQPFLNTWFTSPTPINNKHSSTFTWVEQYSVSLCQVIFQDGVTIQTTISMDAGLGDLVVFSMEDDTPYVNFPVPGTNPDVIQVYLQPKFIYDGWQVGFGVSDPSNPSKDTPVMVVEGSAGTHYNFRPHPKYLVGLASENNTNQLVSESELTDVAAIQFTPRVRSVTVEFLDDGSWNIIYPKQGNSTVAASKLVKRTVTTTTIEEFA